jgi:hypothetical protein
MNIRELFEQALKEGGPSRVVVPNKMGVKKAFPSMNAAAKAWKNDTSKPVKAAPKVVKYSKEWWDEQPFGDIHPDSKIQKDRDGDEIMKCLEKQGMGDIDNYQITRRGEDKLDKLGLVVATAKLRVSFSLDAKEYGLESDEERVSDSQSVIVRRDAMKPDKIVFVGYA